MRFLLRVATGSNASALRPTGIQGYVIYQICVCHGGCKCPGPEDATCDKPVPVHHSVNQQKCSKPSVCCWGASWMPLSGSDSPDFLLGWWRFHICILWNYPHWPIPQRDRMEILSPSGSTNQSTRTGRCEGWHLQATRAVALERATGPTIRVVPAAQLGGGAMLSSSTITTDVCKIFS